MEKLNDMVKKAKGGNEESMIEIIEKFRPLIRKYSRKLNYDDAEADIIIFLIETIKKIPIFNNSNLNKDECIVGYINTSIKNRYISLSKKYISIASEETELNVNILLCCTLQDEQKSIDNHIFVTFLLDKLPHYQKQIIENIFIDNIPVTDLSKRLHISRQSVNRAKNRALSNLKKYAGE
ncbi:sigma-70 family RNA polymerase sigma factor [Clostridium akagii]|uniref:sigma-70 family RNA polymerase sigma factor n=1 Tax=Clostridium akagii TaxID=91623 RepID=UPI00047873C0|nr:sigma-70 family RNA polymerase sigma factor [Clostridium akagii]